MTTYAGLLPRAWIYVIVAALVLTTVGAEVAPEREQACAAWPPDTTLPTVRVPDPDPGVQALEARRQSQLAGVRDFGVFSGFRFANRDSESGITFLNHPVDDAGRTYKQVHYDHGTGIAVADVDGDGLYDVYFVNQVGGNQLWRNLGGGRFADITASGGVAVPGRISVGASFADIDNDGRPDLYVTTVRGGNVLFHNDGGGRFADISKTSGLDYIGHSSGAVFFDYDRDGLLDLFLVNLGHYTTDRQGCGGYYVGRDDAFRGHLHPELTEYSRLYRNLGNGRFADMTEATGLRDGSWSGDATFTDLNGTGYPSVYVLNMQGRNHYWENRDGRTFEDRTDAYLARTPYGAMGVKFFDWNNDGRTDLFVTDMHSDMMAGPLPADAAHENGKAHPNSSRLARIGALRPNLMFGNAFYESRGGGRFEEVSDSIGAETYWPWGPSVGDLNADGWEDVFIAAGMGYPFRYGINSVLLNDRGKRFRDAEFVLGVEPRPGPTTLPWFEVDCGTAQQGQLCRGQNGRITVMGAASTRSAAIFDLNADGALDIVTNEFGGRPMILVSDLAHHRPIHWVQVKLVGTRSNRDGLGATVKVTAGASTYTKYSDGKSGYLSQSVLPLYFGLGDATRLERIEVLWPSGTRQIVTKGLAVNSTVQIAESR